jgi:tetratricopeptide (TPR) repeat protein
MKFRKIILILAILTFVLFGIIQMNFLYKLGKYSFLELHNLSLAELSLEKSIYFNDKDSEAYFLLGRIYFVENNLSKSEYSFKKALELDPEMEQAHYGLGLTYGYMNALPPAAASFQKYLDLCKEKVDSGEYKNYPSGHWAGYNDLAWIYFLQGDFEKAEKVTAEALRKYNNPWLFNMMGAILLNQGKKKEAEIYFLRAKEYAKNMTWQDFGEAYTGDTKDWQKKGFASMKAIIEENLSKSK